MPSTDPCPKLANNVSNHEDKLSLSPRRRRSQRIHERHLDKRQSHPDAAQDDSDFVDDKQRGTRRGPRALVDVVRDEMTAQGFKATTQTRIDRGRLHVRLNIGDAEIINRVMLQRSTSPSPPHPTADPAELLVDSVSQALSDAGAEGAAPTFDGDNIVVRHKYSFDDSESQPFTLKVGDRTLTGSVTPQELKPSLGPAPANWKDLMVEIFGEELSEPPDTPER